MGQLLSDLLRLSHTTRGTLDPQPLDLSAEAQSVLADLVRQDPQRKVDAAVTPGLKAVGDRQLVKLVLENLLSNAWKYSAQTAQARIEFGITARDDQSVFFVRDNGVGFDMAYASRLFGTFQQLHSGQEYTGTGIGLAIAQRIIHRHGGLIWADSAPGKGATFFFTLPGR
jgi:light-regulated signal transduction histidine kinase (bacteriophytochrome)